MTDDSVASASASGPGSVEEAGSELGGTESGSGEFIPTESGPSGVGVARETSSRGSDGPSRGPAGPVASAGSRLIASGWSGDSVSRLSVTSAGTLWPSSPLGFRSLPSSSAAGAAASPYFGGSCRNPGSSEGGSDSRGSCGGVFSGPSGTGGFGGGRSGNGFAGPGGR